MAAAAKKPPSGEARIEYVPLPEIVRWPRNPKRHDEAALEQSMKRFGFVQPLLFDEKTGRLVAGHGRLDLLEKLREDGKEPPARIVVRDGTWHVPVVRGIAFETENDAEAYVLADNHIVELGGWDAPSLNGILQDQIKVAGGEEGLFGTGFSPEEVERIAKQSAAAVHGGAPGEFSQFDENLATHYTCPKCSYTWSGRPR